MTDELTAKTCKPCEGGVVPLQAPAIAIYQAQLAQPWEVVDGTVIRYEFRFGDFKNAIAFVNRVADLAEQEGHHPDLRISYRRVAVELTTHAIGGLSENDFILAAKIEKLV